ncbi:hypothetical protein NDA11_007775 [Ustilago hordei]|uniref:Related to retrotransposon HobS hobase n=1 Tax=Ustilago hordei TaxID=120017 RepID=I2FNG6_USTHO|nr:hypothetical protein NDA10_006913 [Ustilago hordei]KAJ1572397.1 hypothetical protein NDA11_007775 [Ustilago hordei]KAJ1591385.1 hypothetical protein NDA15_003167 [Ustilago hordei]KAJ1593602.1 hypothetical protein NDA12_001105 [Ustilago hordei]KAJ1604040.1 hypothetical protein NDA14_005722 [Ustilago hordei]
MHSPMQINFVTAYLNGELTDVNIYLVLPPGFEDQYTQTPQSVCHLKKALYRLKQSGLEWFVKLDKSLHQMGFKQLGWNIAVYKMESDVTAVYVDNIIIVGQDSEVDAIIDLIQSCFKITGGDNAQ